jgi:hypothetical protein
MAISLISHLTDPSVSQDGFDLIKKIANIPVVSRAYNPECNINYIVGMVRMLKHVDSRDSADRKDHFATLIMLTDCFDYDAIAEVIEFGSKFIADIDDAITITKILRNVQGKVYPIDRRIAFAIKSGLLEMCFDFLTRFTCDPTVQLLARDPKRDDLIGCLVGIADNIKSVALHKNTSKAIRDRRSQIFEALTTLVPQLKSVQSAQFVEILSSIMDLNEGSCSRCNKSIEWRTALFCEGCRRVAYCCVKCQKKDWKHGTHSSDCSLLARSGDVLGLTRFAVRRSRNISELTGLRNNIVTSQKKLFLRHESSLLSRWSDRSDYIVVFNLSIKQLPIDFIHYHDQFTCPKKRKWFEDLRSSDKIICKFTSGVYNGELDEDELYNMITLWAAFSLR